MVGRLAVLGAALISAFAMAPVSAQTPPPSSGQDKAQELKSNPEVRASQLPDPTPQGTRPPDPIGAPADRSELWNALQAVWRAPPDLQGIPVPRPNQWASNPENPLEPTRSENPSALSSHEIRP